MQDLLRFLHIKWQNRIGKALEFLCQIAHIETIWEIRLSLTGAPVSYTHLDVYKRQPADRATFFLRF